MARPKSAYQQFQTDWNQRASWAQSNGIHQNLWIPVMQLDYKRLQSGTSPMSNYEAQREIESVATNKHVTPQPQLNPYNVPSNFLNDQKSFWSGLGNLFVHPMSSFVDPVLHGIEQLPHTTNTMLSDLSHGHL